MKLSLVNPNDLRSHSLNKWPFAVCKLLLLAAFLPVLASDASAQLINLNFQAATAYTNTSETSPATTNGAAGTWNNITTTSADQDVAISYADGSSGPTLSFDAGINGNWTATTFTTATVDYTTAGGVYNVTNLYESGFINNGNSTFGFRVKGLAAGTYKVHVVPMFRAAQAASVKADSLVHMYIGTGNDTDARGIGNFTLVTTNANPTQNIDTRLTSWTPATDGSTAYNYITATVSIDDTNRWLTFLFEDSATSGPDRPGPAVIQIEPSNGLAPTAPLIDSEPVDQSVLVGQDATFNVIASGTPPLSYHWYYNTNTSATNGIVSSSSTSSSFTVTNAQLLEAGGYSVVVTNSYGSVTSLVAHLIVNAPVAPSIGTQPQNQTNILPGATATFSVVAFGTDPLNYQWFHNTNTPVPNATAAILTITNVQATNAGSYSVVVNNAAGTTNSAYAFLTVNTNPVAPVFNSQPVSQIVLAGSTVSFSDVVGGTAPISYQWSKNGTPIPGATSSTLSLSNVQTTNNGSYTLTATNSVGSATSSPAQLTVTTATLLVNSAYNLVGFGQATTGGGVIPDTNAAYAKVTTPLELATAVAGFNKNGSPKVIEIMNDLDLGWNEIGSAVQTLSGTPFSAHNPVQLHPRLLVTGVSKMDIKYKNGGLTIFSANGATIRHCTFNIKATQNIIVRNLKFDEMWEWDEASKGQYDKNDWDYIDTGNGGAVSNVWIDHCTFTKSYDGIVDFKAGSTGISFSWCKYTGDDGATNTNSFVWQQINALEANKSAYAFYNFLRNNGFSTTNIVQIIQGHDKTHLMGSNDKDPNNVNLSATFHHLWMNNCWDRAVPRLRAGNVHDFNNYVDDTGALAALRLRNAVQATMSSGSSNTLQNTYSFNPPLNGSISTEGGAVLVEKCVYIDSKYPLRNNQTAPSDPTYTGKILGLDMIYQFDSTTVRGNSTDPGSPLGPFQAPIIAFSWNPGSGAPGGQLPYTYTPDDPSQLQNIVTSPTAGAGAGVLAWNKTNWLLTAYAATVPTITAQPQSQTVAPSNNVTFTVVASGSANLFYQWYRNTNSLIANATNSTFTLNNVQATNAGTYSVIVTNTSGSVTSSFAVLTVAAASYAKPQLSSATFSNGVFRLTVSGDAGPDYIVQTSTNLTTWQSLFTNHLSTPPFNWSDSNAASFTRRFYRIQLGP